MSDNTLTRPDASAMMPSLQAAGPADRSFFGHPRGLGILAFTEGWIGFSYYGMQSLLVLYLVDHLLRPGHVDHVLGFDPFHRLLEAGYGVVSGQALASAIMGLYAALYFATPILGGLLADRVLGRTQTIILGSVLMTLGHFLMAFDASFLIALTCILVGAGCAGSIKAQVGGLYRPDDPRRTDAFQIYTMSVCLAVIAAPLVCGTLGETYAWHWGFAAAGVGMMVGLAIYLAGRHWLPPEPPSNRTLIDRTGLRRARIRLTRSQWQTVALLLLLLPVLAVASVGNMEIFNGYLIWAQRNYALVLFGHRMPVSWLMSLDAFIGVLTLLLSVLFWRWWGRRRAIPGEMAKMLIGTLLMAAAPLVLAAASWWAGSGHRIGLGWALAFHILDDIGFSNFFAIGISLFARLAPPTLGATIVNAFSLHLFLSNLLVGWLAGLLGQMSGVRFWLLHAGLIAAAGLALAVIAWRFRHLLAGPEPDPPPARFIGGTVPFQTASAGERR